MIEFYFLTKINFPFTTYDTIFQWLKKVKKKIDNITKDVLIKNMFTYKKEIDNTTIKDIRNFLD